MIQQTLALSFVALAAGYLLRGTVAALRSTAQKKPGCAGGCGCTVKTAPALAATKRSLPILRQ